MSDGSEQPRPIDYDAMLAPLAAICASQNLTFSWRTRPKGKQWVADLRAGWPYVDGKLTGARPWYSTVRDTEAEALKWVVDCAVGHWAKR